MSDLETRELEAKELEFSENDLEFFKENAVGITIIYLSSILHEDDKAKHHSPLDYHLHVLVFFDISARIIGGICLDTSDIYIYPIDEDVKKLDVGRTVCLELAKKFVERLNSALLTDHLEEVRIFDRADESLWHKFNEIKRKSFILTVKRIKLR